MEHLHSKNILLQGRGYWPALFLVLICLLAPCDRADAAPAEKDRTAALVEGAKKEGKVVLYTTTAPTPFIKRFKEIYPFLDVEFTRTGEDNILLKILAEERARKNVVDVTSLTLNTAEILKSKGLFVKYLSPHREFYPEVSREPEGYWTDTFLNLNVLGYNTKLVPLREVPKTYQDLLDPKWKGKIGMDSKAYWWFANMVKVMGEKRGLEYMKGLGEQQLMLRNGRTLNTQMLAAGEMRVLITTYNYMVEDLKVKGAPVEWAPLDPVIPELHPLAISAHAPHPHAAKLYVDFLLSREGQEIMASTFRIPSRVDVDALVPKLKKGIKILPVDYSLFGSYEKNAKLYREILMKR